MRVRRSVLMSAPVSVRAHACRACACAHECAFTYDQQHGKHVAGGQWPSEGLKGAGWEESKQ
eukprot:8001887-Alexandrium_andersonii.AAC.1